MLETTLLGIQQLASIEIWIVLVAGSLLGIILGAIPGLSLIHISEPTRPY